MLEMPEEPDLCGTASESWTIPSFDDLKKRIIRSRGVPLWEPPTSFVKFPGAATPMELVQAHQVRRRKKAYGIPAGNTARQASKVLFANGWRCET